MAKKGGEIVSTEDKGRFGRETYASSFFKTLQNPKVTKFGTFFLYFF